MTSQIPIYKTKENYEKFRTTLINFVKYKIVMFTMAKLMESTEQNRVVMYLLNII